jgi:hypothetical protein
LVPLPEALALGRPALHFRFQQEQKSRSTARLPRHGFWWAGCCRFNHFRLALNIMRAGREYPHLLLVTGRPTLTLLVLVVTGLLNVRHVL